jgi:hypothetical protein
VQVLRIHVQWQPTTMYPWPPCTLSPAVAISTGPSITPVQLGWLHTVVAQDVDWLPRNCSQASGVPNVCQDLHGGHNDAIAISLSWSLAQWNRLLPLFALRPHAQCAVQKKSEFGMTWACQASVVQANGLQLNLKGAGTVIEGVGQRFQGSRVY